jgi:N-acetylmuramoyl-L-alanine amidase
MKDLEAIKLRLVREAIRQNMEGSPPSRPKMEARRRFALPLWVAGSFLLAGVLYLALPSVMVSRSIASPHTSAGASMETTLSIGNRPESSDVLDLAPRRLGRSVLPLSVRKIVLDPGHGGTQLGASSDSGVLEKEITLDIALRLRQLLEDANFEVLMTRETDETLSLERRAAFANRNHADLFVSIHVNWIPQRQVRPLETYFVGPTDEPAVLRLATVENVHSGYSLAAYRRLLDKIYIDTRRDESRALATSLHTELYRSLSEVNPELQNRGVKTAPFAVLVGTEMPAILVEVSCLSNQADVDLLTSADYRDRVALALLRGVRIYANGLDGVGGIRE